MEKTKQLILRLTDRCNLQCKYCYAACNAEGTGGKVYDMSWETARKAIDLFAEPGGRLKIQFTGGEPLLCTALLKDIFRYVKEQKMQTMFSLQTNGTLLTPEHCSLLKEMGCAVGISLDGIAEANGLRVYPDGRESFEDVLKGIQNLRSQKMFCNFNSVVTGQNQSKLDELLELAVYFGNVRGVGLDMFRPLGRGKEEDLVPNRETLSADLIKMLQRRKELEQLGVKIRIKELEKMRSMLAGNLGESCYCYAQTGLSAAVDPRGDIYPCSSFVGMKEFCMGNVEEGFAFRNNVPGPDENCKHCDERLFCKGGCPAGRAACGGCNAADCLMHRTIIKYAQEQEYCCR